MSKRLLILFLLCLPGIVWGEEPQQAQTEWKPDAMRAVWLGAICPGMGQIYNRSYWKLPIVYGGLMGCGYAIATTQTKYTSYKAAYLDAYYHPGIVSDPNWQYNYLIPNGYSSNITTLMEGNMNNYRRYRDISIVATVLVYMLTLVDAYVDAQLFDFDISPNLSVDITPDIYEDHEHRKSTEVKLALRF